MRSTLYETLARVARACGLRAKVHEQLVVRDAAWQDTFDQSPQPALVADAGSLRILAANAELRRCLALGQGQIRSTLPELFHQDGVEGEFLERLRNPNPQSPLVIRQSLQGQHIDLELRGYQVSSGGRRLVAFTALDVTLRSKFEEALLQNQNRLDHLAHHDQLTSLPNRLFLAAHLPEAIAKAKRDGQMLAILFLDLDRFKHINDTRGHETATCC